MRFCRTLPHAASVPAVCVLLCLGALNFQGCKPSEEPPKETASDRLYTKLDERFPEGRPGVTDTATRMEDPEYRKNLQSAATVQQALSDDLAQKQKAVARFREAYAKGMTKPDGSKPDDAALDAALVNHAHYQSLVAEVETAQAKVKEQQVAGRELIRARMFREQKEYDALKAEADAAAKAEGKAIRPGHDAFTVPAKAQQAAAPTQKPTSPTPTAKDLAEQLNKPLVETAK